MDEMERYERRGQLYDFYGPLLNEHQRRIYEEAVLSDYSVSEIAGDEGISRQGVHDLIKRCDGMLEEYDRKLGLIERFSRVKELVTRIHESGDPAEIKELSDRILDIL